MIRKEKRERERKKKDRKSSGIPKSGWTAIFSMLVLVARIEAFVGRSTSMHGRMGTGKEQRIAPEKEQSILAETRL